MTICLFVSHGILLNLGITQNFSFDCELPYTVYLVTAAIVLIISALPFPFLVGSYVVTIIIFGKTFDATSRSCLEMPLLFPILYLSLFWCTAKLSLCKTSWITPPQFSLIRSKRFVTTIQVVDITGKSHIFTFAPYATIKDLRSQVNTKFRITSNLCWLSCCGKPLLDFFTFGWNKQNSFHAWKIDWRCSMLFEGMWKWGRIKKIWQHGWTVWT